MAAIMPYEMLSWEKLFWFVKFLIPKMVIKDKGQDKLDELLNSVDLSTYGSERVKLSTHIELDASETQLDPQNANPRGTHGDSEKDALESIIEAFNEKWFHGWDETPQGESEIHSSYGKSKNMMIFKPNTKKITIHIPEE